MIKNQRLFWATLNWDNIIKKFNVQQNCTPNLFSRKSLKFGRKFIKKILNVHKVGNFELNDFCCNINYIFIKKKMYMKKIFMWKKTQIKKK